uniref:Apolipoprotein A-II n=1 Tax=Echeneis naucrates TaxID=173247 RepID=A0A665T4L3_ECHNA
MNAKYALALILALQVSMCLCEAPAPSQELVDKYDALRITFYKRLLNALGKVQEAVGPAVQRVSESEQGASILSVVDRVQDKPELAAVLKVASGLGEEAAPLVEKARASVLGAYEQYLRPYVGRYLNDGIDRAKYYLDKFLPAE